MFYDLNKNPKVLSTLSKPSRNTRQTFKNDKVCDSTILNRSIRAHLCPTETFHCFDCRRLPYLSLLERTKKKVSSNDACVIPKKIKFAENGCFTCVVLRLKHRFHSKDRISIRVSPMFVKSRMSAGNIYYLFIAVFLFYLLFSASCGTSLSRATHTCLPFVFFYPSSACRSFIDGKIITHHAIIWQKIYRRPTQPLTIYPNFIRKFCRTRHSSSNSIRRLLNTHTQRTTRMCVCGRVGSGYRRYYNNGFA